MSSPGALHAWRAASPLRTAIGVAPRVVEGRHDRALAAWRPMRLTSSLGHSVSLDWGGIVRAEPVRSGRPVRRGGSALDWPSWSGGVAEPESEPVVEPVAEPVAKPAVERVAGRVVEPARRRSRLAAALGLRRASPSPDVPPATSPPYVTPRTTAGDPPPRPTRVTRPTAPPARDLPLAPPGDEPAGTAPASDRLAPPADSPERPTLQPSQTDERTPATAHKPALPGTPPHRPTLQPAGGDRRGPLAAAQRAPRPTDTRTPYLSLAPTGEEPASARVAGPSSPRPVPPATARVSEPAPSPRVAGTDPAPQRSVTAPERPTLRSAYHEEQSHSAPRPAGTLTADPAPVLPSDEPAARPRIAAPAPERSAPLAAAPELQPAHHQEHPHSAPRALHPSGTATPPPVASTDPASYRYVPPATSPERPTLQPSHHELADARSAPPPEETPDLTFAPPSDEPSAPPRAAGTVPAPELRVPPAAAPERPTLQPTRHEEHTHSAPRPAGPPAAEPALVLPSEAPAARPRIADATPTPDRSVPPTAAPERRTLQPARHDERAPAAAPRALHPSGTAAPPPVAGTDPASYRYVPPAASPERPTLQPSHRDERTDARSAPRPEGTPDLTLAPPSDEPPARPRAARTVPAPELRVPPAAVPERPTLQPARSSDRASAATPRALAVPPRVDDTDPASAPHLAAFAPPRAPAGRPTPHPALATPNVELAGPARIADPASPPAVTPATPPGRLTLRAPRAAAAQPVGPAAVPSPVTFAPDLAPSPEQPPPPHTADRSSALERPTLRTPRAPAAGPTGAYEAPATPSRDLALAPHIERPAPPWSPGRQTVPERDVGKDVAAQPTVAPVPEPAPARRARAQVPAPERPFTPRPDAPASTGLLGHPTPALRIGPDVRPQRATRTEPRSARHPEPAEALLGHVPTALLAAAPASRPDPATAASVSRLTGVPVDRAIVRRGAGVGDAARALGAAAFTHDGVVHLPDRHGPAGTTEARALLAHELTHVAQHVRATLDPAHRPPLRPRDELEAEAREVAQRVARAARPTAEPARPEPPARADTTRVQRHTETPGHAAYDDDVPDDATLDRQARLLYPRVRALLDADLARDRQRAGRR